MKLVHAVLLACVAAAAHAQRPVGDGFTIAGRLIDSTGRAPERVGLTAWTTTGETSSSGAYIPIAADGSFKSRPLQPGTYALVVGPSAHLPMNADVDGGLLILRLRTADLAGLVIKTARYALRGRYVMRSDNPRARWPSHLHVTAPLIEPDAPHIGDGSEGAPNGEFVLRNLFGKRLLRVGYSLDRGDHWWFDQVLLDGTDITDVPTDFSQHPNAKLEIAFTQHPARVNGVAVNPDGTPAAGAWVVAMGADPSLWSRSGSYTADVQAGRNGEFSLATRPGRLLVAALPPFTHLSLGSISKVNLAKLGPRATPVTVGGRGTTTVKLQLVKLQLVSP